MYKFAILGGMFNPIHNGHIYIAEQLISKGIAEKIIFMPSGNHPLKLNNNSLSYNDRFSLIEKAISGNPKFEVSKLDSPEYGINYTYNLIQRIKENYNNKSDFTFLIGMDNAISFSKWFQHDWLLENVEFTVVSRTSDREESSNIDCRFKVVEIAPYDVSSTQVRNRLNSNESIDKLVPTIIIKELKDYWKVLS